MIDYNSLKTGAGIFEVLEKANSLERAGKEILHFEIGQPDTHTPAHVKEAAKKALDDNFTGYVASSGILELKQAIQEEISVTRGFKPSIDQILVLPGANPGIYYSLRSILENINEEIIYPDPGFPTYAAVVNYLGAGNVPIPTKERNEFRLNPTDIEEKITTNSKILIINSPQNPTGSVMTKEEIDRIAELSEEYNFYVLSDEIYSKMIYDHDFYSISVHDNAQKRTVILDGFSKAYSMTGWRLGYAVGPKTIIERMNILISMGVSCTSSFVQKGGVAALKGPQEELKSNMEMFRSRRDAIVKGLKEIPGFSCLVPQGAFYVFPNIKKTGMTSRELSDHLMYNAGVVCLPGNIFGKNGEGYLRFSYTTSLENIKKAIERIKNLF